MRKKDELIRDILAQFEASHDEIMELGDWFWKNPEPGFRECKTGKKAVDVLDSLGLNVKLGLALTGARADLNGHRPGPTLALLGEMDSLILPSHPQADPVTGAVHACGHCAHVTDMLGAAMALVRSGAAEELGGRVAFITCPAEECIELDFRADLIKAGKIRYLGGKQELIAEGVFDDVDMAAMLHLGSYGLPEFNGFVMKKVVFKGKSCHAASPQNGVNAMNVANLAQHAIALMRETFSNDSTIRVHGLITQAGDSINIIPDRAVLNYQLRANASAKIAWLSHKFDCAMRGAAMAFEADVDITTYPGYMPMTHDPGLVDAYRKAVSIVSPESKVRDPRFDAGSSDMGDVSQVVPALHGGVPGSSGTGHGKDYAIANPEMAFVGGSKLLALLAVDLLYGDAALGWEVASRKSMKMTHAQYLSAMDQFSTTENWKNKK